jgi:hypothetical protein
MFDAHKFDDLLNALTVAIFFGGFRKARHQRALALNKQRFVQTPQCVDLGAGKIAPLQANQIET